MTGYAPCDEPFLRDVAHAAVDLAVKLGATGASANARAGGGVNIKLRDGIPETAMRDGYQSLGVTVFREGRAGTASTVALDPASIARAVDEAFAIAGYVRSDADAGLADPAMLAFGAAVPETYAPSNLAPEALMERALELETVAMDRARRAAGRVRIVETGVGSSDHLTALATSAGFCRSSAASIHSQWTMALGEDGAGAVRDYAQDIDRRVDRLDPFAAIADEAVSRTATQLERRSILGRQAPVLFDARIASALVHPLVAALSGGSQHSRTTVLPDAIDTVVAAEHVDLYEDPFEPFGIASGGWDGEGVAGSRRAVVDRGRCAGYFLGSLSARRLGLRSTGNAGGPWNLTLSGRSGGDATAMQRTMDTGLLVTQLLGGGSDPVTGTWTQAVAGFWVEGGEVVHPVIDVTLGGNLAEMWKGIVAVGTDVRREGAVRSGSILIGEMRIGGMA